MYAEQWTYPRAQQGDWTEERIATLKQLLAERMPPRAIAIHLGGVTKNAVIGKARRLGLAIRSNPQCREFLPKRGKRTSPKRRPAPGRITQDSTPRIRIRPSPPADLVVIYDEVYVGPAMRKGVLDLEPGDCRWGHGDPKQPGFHFCGGKALPGQSWCEHHARRVYEPTRHPIDTRQRNVA